MVDPAPPLKVCHVFASTEGGRWVYEQLDALRRDHGCDVRVVLPHGPGSTVDTFERAGIPVHRFDFRIWGIRALLSLPFRVLRLALWMRRERIEVVQSHIIPSTFFARPAAWLADVPVRLVMVTSPYYMQAPSIRWMEAATARLETGVIPSCRLTADLYAQAGVPARLIQPILYYGPPKERFDPGRAVPEGLHAEFGLAAEAKLIGAVAVFYARCGGGSFVPPETRHRFIKGHTDLFDAMPAVLEAFPEARLVMVGKGWGPSGAETEKELADYVAARGLQKHVIFAGWRSSSAAVYMDLDVSVQASVNENLGGTIESLLMARPTVATRAGGMADAVVDGETGIQVDPGDPADLARGIIEMLRDPERAACLGRAGRERMLAGFTLESTVPGLASLYRRQRGEARGAWRAHMLLARLVLAVLLGAPLFVRAMVVDIFLLNMLPPKIGSVRRRLRAARDLLRRSRSAHDPGGRTA
jgi:glycosyltransferase involved in cell wall biosynthesis